VTLLGILIATVMFALVVRAFAQSYGERRGVIQREVDWPDDPRLLDIGEVAAELETTPDEVMHLVVRDAIPHLVVAGIDRSSPEAYRFDRDEISDWVIG
jgi:hypothetical protein